MELYSSTAPTGWNQLPIDLKQKFYDVGAKGDWSGMEAYDHLVPNHLKDNPDEVVAWMDGAPSLDIPDRDVSRIISGENGGEYSAENTIMEDMSANRARGSADMTDVEYEQVVADNTVDANTIEAHFESATETVSSTVPDLDVTIFDIDPAPMPESTILGEAGEALLDGFLPAVAAYKVGTYIGGKFEDPVDQVGYGSLAGGLAAAYMCTPAGPPTAVALFLFGLGKIAYKRFA